jgi:hypothetical protein
MYSGLKQVKRQHRLATQTKQRRLVARTKMAENDVAKMELDVKEGRYYVSGMHVDEGDMEGDIEGVPPAKNKNKSQQYTYQYTTTNASTVLATTRGCHQRTVLGKAGQKRRFHRIMRKGSKK